MALAPDIDTDEKPDAGIEQWNKRLRVATQLSDNYQVDDDGLTDSELLVMWETYIETGRPETGKLRETLLTHYWPLCSKVGNSMAQKLPQHVDRDDLTSWAALGLMRAIKHYDPSPSKERNTGSFTTYAIASMRSVILDEIRKLDWAPRSLRKKQRDIDKVRTDLQQSMGVRPSDLQVADMLGIPVLVLRRIEQETAASWHAYLEERDDADELSTGPVGEELAVTVQLRAALVAEFNRMSPTTQVVIALVYFEEKSTKEIAELLHSQGWVINEAAASALHRNGIARLHAAMVGCLDVELAGFASA